KLHTNRYNWGISSHKHKSQTLTQTGTIKGSLQTKAKGGSSHTTQNSTTTCPFSLFLQGCTININCRLLSLSVHSSSVQILSGLGLSFPLPDAAQQAFQQAFQQALHTHVRCSQFALVALS